MKKLFLLLILTMFLFGCGGNGNGPGPVPPSPPSDPTKFTFFNKTYDFLKIVSYFDAIRSVALQADMDYLKSMGVDGIRIFVNMDWFQHTPVDNDHRIMFRTDGTLRTDKVASLKHVLDICQKKGIIVDISFVSHPIGISEVALRKGIIRLLRDYLKPWGFKNVLFDLANEHHKISQTTANALAQDMRNIMGNDFWYTLSMANNCSPEQACDKQIRIEKCNSVRYHDPRVSGWSHKSQGLAQRLKKCAGNRPAYFDEPTARGYSDQCEKSASDFVRACQGAKKAGIAAWCFHTYAGFVLHKKSFQSQLDSEEKKFLNLIGKI